jgi:hypothetical protein
MRKTALTLGILLVCALPAAAQYQQVGVAFGGTKRLYDRDERDARLSQSFNLTDVKEVWYGFRLEPDTMLKFKVGELDAPVGTAPSDARPDEAITSGRIEHGEIIVDYKFDEPFGSTGIFLGAGMYREKEGRTSPETDFGWSGGVNGDFPINRRFGVTVEGTYHSISFSYKPRIITATVGLRMTLF